MKAYDIYIYFNIKNIIIENSTVLLVINEYMMMILLTANAINECSLEISYLY
jgi:hypothetical protein